MSLASRFFGAAESVPSPADVSVSLPLDDAFEMFWTDRRRWLLRTVAQQDTGEGVSLTELSRDRSAVELDTPPEFLDSKDTKNVYVGFYQTHLPRLDNAGLVEFDDSGGTIYSTDATHDAVEFIDVAESMVESVE